MPGNPPSESPPHSKGQVSLGRLSPYVPVSKGRDEVEAAVHPVVLDVLPVQATLVPEILLKLLVYVVGHRLPAGGEMGQVSGEQGCLAVAL